jgi:signal transduction histidine kinase
MRLLVLGLAAFTVALLPDAGRAALQRPLETFAWVALVSLAGLRTVWISPGSGIEFSPRTPISSGLAVVLGPPLTLFVTLVALVSEHELRRRHNPWMVAFNHLQLGFCGYVTALAAGTVDGLVPCALVAVATHSALNAGLVATAAWLLGRRRLLDALRDAVLPFPWFATNYVVLGLMSVLVVVLLDHSSWAVWLALLPVWLGFTGLHSAKRASDRAEELTARVHELEVLAQLSTSLLSTRDHGAVATLATHALGELCAGSTDGFIVDLDGDVPAHLSATEVPGTSARVGLPPGLGARRTAEAATVLAAVGLALQRLDAEDDLRESQRAQAALAERILAEGAIARSRVALHVHDDVLPFLAAAQIQADNALSAAERGDPALTGRLSEAVRDAIADGIRTLREVLDDLRNATLLPGDLLPWLRGACERLRFEHGLRVSLDVGGFDADVSHPVEVLLAETVQGLLANVVRHARASQVALRLGSSADSLALEIRDDGVGFDPDRVRGEAHGLSLLRQRVALVDGRLTIDSRPGGGTTVTLHVPLGVAGGRLTPLTAPERVSVLA